jgi:hypothetical protein
VTTRLDNNRQIEFNANDHRHFDHGYAVPVPAPRASPPNEPWTHADTRVHPDLLNSRFAYVSISRASQEATVFTDDITKLGPQLGAEVSKASALKISQYSSLGQEIGLGLGCRPFHGHRMRHFSAEEADAKILQALSVESMTEDVSKQLPF